MNIATIIFIAVAVAGLAFVWWQTRRVKTEEVEPQAGNKPEPTAEPTKPAAEPDNQGQQEAPVPDPVECHTETHKIDTPVTSKTTDEQILVGTYDVDKDGSCGCQWSVTGYEGERFLDDFVFENGNIYANVVAANEGDERTCRILTHHSCKGGERDDYFDVVQQAGYDQKFEDYLSKFNSIVEIKRGTENYKYMKNLYDEAKKQYYGNGSLNGIPAILTQENFPSMGGNGMIEDHNKAFATLIGFLFAMHLGSLRPKDKTSLGKIGYELGGYDKYANIYGYTFDSDPNNMRIMAGAIHAAMRGVLNPDTDVLRREIGGSKFDKTLKELGKGSRDDVSDGSFFADLRKFMSTAPGPYAPGYSNRPDKPYPGETRDEFGNLQVDRDIHEMIVRDYNLDNDKHRQAVVQAIADKEADKHHLFGKNRKTEHYEFSPVFGKDNIGIELPDDGELAEFASVCFTAMSSARGILQSASTDPKQYGRLRPGCSWKQEACKNSASDDRRNILVEVEVEDNDGCKETPNTYGSYDKEGYWVYTKTEKDQYAESQKNALYANSYPSGHSSGIMGVAFFLIELFPMLTDVILRAAIWYAINRTIARYHWTSDMINGRVIGAFQSAIAHAASDYDEMLEAVKKELGLL